MVAQVDTHPVAEFQQRVVETLDRINRTGEAEVITIDGEIRGILLSPAAYDALTIDTAFTDEDAAMVQLSIQQLRAGQGRNAFEFLDEVRAKLLAGEFRPVGKEAR